MTIFRRWPPLVIAVTSLVALFSCTSSQPNREIASLSTDSVDELHKIFRVVFDADEARNLAQVAYESIPIAPNPSSKSYVDNNALKRARALAVFNSKNAYLKQVQDLAKDKLKNFPGSLGKTIIDLQRPYPGTLRETLSLRKFESFSKSKNAFYIFPMGEIANYELTIHNSLNKANLKSVLTCNAPFDLIIPGMASNHKSTLQAEFTIKERFLAGEDIKFIPTAKVTRCDLQMIGKVNGQNSEGFLRFVRALEHVPSSAWAFKPSFEGCSLPQISNEGPSKFFLSSGYRNMTCPLQASEFDPLPDPIEAIQSKVEALLGQRLSDSFIRANNPYAKLDYSKMPQLDAILISSLVFRSDYHGAILRRLIEEHARRGAVVRIIVTEVLTFEKDRAALEEMEAAYPNIRVQIYRWKNVLAAGDGGVLDPLHRTMHHKLFIVLAKDPAKNVAIMGGRNIHDGFAFSDAPDTKKFPHLAAYGTKGEPWSPWRDFEVRSRSPELVSTLARHWNKFWIRDSESMAVPNASIAVPAAATHDTLHTDENWVRHFLSIPFKDDKQLELYYADLLSSARKSIVITSPYFRPTPILGEAIREAAARGVKVTIVTRLDLTGDVADFILGEVNKKGINSVLVENTEIFQYMVPNEILHTKLILIDETLSVVGSVNLNKRSFIHDTESGLLIHNKEFNKQTREMIEGFIKLSSPVTETQKVVFWKGALLGILDDKF